jgi:hypothetical protein
MHVWNFKLNYSFVEIIKRHPTWTPQEIALVIIHKHRHLTLSM